MKHVMIDIETFGRSPGCAIRSVGAVAFEMEGEISENTFYANVDAQSCWLYGLKLERATVDWWSKQPDNVTKLIEQNPQSIAMVVRNLHAWFMVTRAQYVWANGANFDPPIWQAAVDAVGCLAAWQYWDVRCARTICDIAGINIHTEKRKDKHHALSDAIHQVNCLQKAFRVLQSVRGTGNAHKQQHSRVQLVP